MRKTIPCVVAALILGAIFIYLTLAYSASIIINPGPEYIVRVDGHLRILKVFYQGDNLILRFFTDDGKFQFLGEVIFDKDGVKIYDSYIEARGEWPAGYDKRFRK